MKTLINLYEACICFVLLICFIGCGQKVAEKKEHPLPTSPLFSLLTSAQTGVTFENTLTEGLNTNVLMYEYFYNGGGVAVGDLNGDGLDDIYFTANMIANKLYLNKGGMKFEDITASSGTAGHDKPWKTGVTMADVNGDGKLDIYVCYSGNVSPENLRNQLFINQGNNADGVPFFKDLAVAYGLGEPSYSTQAAFFDYDLDGDLDMFLLNHNPKALPILDESSTAELLKKEDPMSGARLFRQDVYSDGRIYFSDITQKAGIHSSPLTYGLGISIADINMDGWQDIYIANDYSIPDFLYINNGNGTFTDQLKDAIGHTSHSSMGSDIADFNNDGQPDIFTLDMLPEDNRRQKLLSGFDNYELFDLNVRVGFHHQYMRNMLQLNLGGGDQKKHAAPIFSEVGQLAGVSNTDWSWAALFADYDNDGWKDLFITNGNLRDFTNLDFVKYMGDHLKRIEGKVKREAVLDLVYQMPSSNMKNYLYKNNTDLTFTNLADQWGLSQISNSNGAVYADLDLDGDLDLVVNNVNQPAFIYQNEGQVQLKNNYLKVQLLGDRKNVQGIGAKVKLYQSGKVQYLEQIPTRGYQSSVSPILHFGLGNATKLDSLEVVWLGGKSQKIIQPGINQLMKLSESEAKQTKNTSLFVKSAFVKIPAPFAYKSEVERINDFKRQPLLVNPIAFAGPCMVKGDINGDGLEDVYVGGNAGEIGRIFVQRKNGTFQEKKMDAFRTDKDSQDTNALFFDVDGDGDLDLFVASGGYARLLPEDVLLQSRVYVNDGKGHFSKKADALPKMRTSISCVVANDVNGDGKMDLFVGGRVIPGRYPEAPRSYILINDGKGNFKDDTENIAPEIKHLGMVTDAAWVDLNGDSRDELVVVGEWMPVTVFENSAGKYVNNTLNFFSKKYAGWWNKILVQDINGDGKPDLLIGNMGTNSQCKVSDQEPAEMLYKDFDENGSIDPILSFYIQGKSYPYITRDEMLDQMSIMRTRFQSYKSYAEATLTNIFTGEELKDAQKLEANYLKTAYFESSSDGKFIERVLPIEVQNAPVYTITPVDYNKDGIMDFLFCGNINHSRLRFGKYDANYGILLKGEGQGKFKYISQPESGFQIKGDVRSALAVGKYFVFGVNQNEIQSYQIATK